MVDALSPSEQAFFESGGETEIVETPIEQAPDQPTQPEPAAEVVEPEAQEQGRDEKGRFVPHQALHAEREEHKKTKSELEQIRQRQAVLEDRWNTLLKVQQPTQAEQPAPPPNPEEDIFAFAKWQGDQLKALQAKVEGREQEDARARQEADNDRAVWNDWSQSAQSFAQETPDFGDAVKFLSETRDKQLNAMALIDKRFATADGRVQQINAELKAIVLAAKQNEISPAEAVYNIAKNYGFQAPVQAPAADPAKLTLPDSLAKIDAAQNASRTLAATPGRDAGDPVSAEAIANMSQKEFEAWYRDPANAKRFDSMMRG